MLILDSNAISYYYAATRWWLQALSPAELGLPAIVEYELHDGVLRLPPEAANPHLAALAALLRPMQVLPFDSECAVYAARIRAELEAAGIPIGPHNTLIAATALHHQATLVTRNVREYSRVQCLQWLNWHEAR
jgi:tRNA(fMet)-specific endonuclease VapC